MVATGSKEGIALKRLRSTIENKWRKNLKEKLFCLQFKPKVRSRILRSTPSLQDILFVLAQDSRCARATQVVISTSVVEGETWLAIADDGEEIFTNSVSSLLNNKRASRDKYSIEFARRISVLNLFSRGAIVESKRLSVTLAPENFPVNRDIKMRSSNVERGTKIAFPIRESEITELVRIIKCLTTYSPISIIFNGSKFASDNRVLTQV